MLTTSKLAALVLLGALAAGSAQAENKAAAVVNGVSIPQERLELRVKAAAAQGQQDTPELRKFIRDEMINIELLSQEAVKKNLDKQTETAQMLEMAKQQVLVSAFVQDYIKSHPVSDSAVTQAYDTAKKNAGNKEYNVRHILVEKESDAKSLAAKLKKGGKFDKLAEANSKDAGSKDKGGELGWIPVGNISTTFVKPFADAVMNLTKGQVSEPVQSQFGWHIIKLEDVRDLKLPAFEEVKPQIVQRLQQQAVQSHISELRAKAKVD